MYENKMVATIKANGKICREFGEKVYIPFGQEYSILLKNLNSVRSQVRISIDDKDVLNGSSLVLDANSSLELERYLVNNDRGNRFKIVERTSSIDDHLGVGIADGIVRVEFQYERVLCHWS